MDEFVYCNFQLNSALTASRTGGWLAALLFPIGVAVTAVVIRRSPRRVTPGLFWGLVVAFFFLAVAAFWTLVSSRDFLPIMPMLFIFGVARFARYSWRAAAYSAVAVSFAASLYYYADRFENRTDEHITMMNQVLGLTRSGEPLMDIKGETIYRRRPFYHAFETVTRALMQRGDIRDTVAEEMIAAWCYVSQAEGPMYPPRANQFVHDYFLDLGRLRAAGQWIAEDGTFAIAIPGPYVIIDENGHAAGSLDGSNDSGQREMIAGRHQFAALTPGRRVAVLWARAFERGYSPFHLRDREF